MFGVANRAGLQLSFGVRDNVVGKIFASSTCNLTAQWSECSLGPFPLPNSSTLLRPWFELLSVGTAWVDQMQMTATVPFP